ncbi:CHASE3 domain-containing protein [Spirulina subsalsa FACHB-351]|uniref:CHASE3 domain-containing protein n=1 Tax=Spirulina subsalsa FACHB-351 TaxID=234711 RepID=A0ABT3L2L5_9CYAN|nr:methyl-accepting chemotaxis protein [Spirulina subsalsa]MCW6035741.1 CHASE3 domain-containing protein [Spirulina subsalsa FACHB-351]
MFINLSSLTLLLKKLKLRNTILVGYSIPIVLSGVTALVVYVQGVRQVEKQTQQVAQLHEHINQVKDLAFSISAMEKAARGYLMGEKSAELGIYEQWDSRFYEQSEIIRDLIDDPQQRQTLNEIIEVGDRMNELYRRLISYVQLNNRSKSQQIWQQGQVQAITQNLSELVNTFEAYEQAQLAQERQQQQAALQFLTFLVFSIACLSGGIAFVSGVSIASAVSHHLTQEASAITQSSLEIAATMEQQERNTSQQVAAVSHASITFDELNASFRKAEEQAAHSAVDASHALDLSENGKLAVQRTLERMQILENKVEEIRDQTERLREKSSRIETISQLVGELAAQTNMLALNAAVEAARAGEQGRGFGIVATEIRRLADESKTSAQNIGDLIGEIRLEITSTAQATEAGTETVKQGVVISQEMAQAFGGVADAVESVVNNNQMLALNAKQQVAAMEQMLQVMNEITQAAQNNAASVTQVRSGVSFLNVALENLKALV